jgi:hypothetical protein
VFVKEDFLTDNKIIMKITVYLFNVSPAYIQNCGITSTLNLGAFFVDDVGIIQSKEMANLVLTVLSITIGLFFILSGTLKLNTYISEDIYKDMVRKY